jgi:hypothetical protein
MRAKNGSCKGPASFEKTSAMSRSHLASSIATSSSRLAKNGQSRAISASDASPYRSAPIANAWPRPYQPVRMERHCVQANTHGIARRSCTPRMLRRLAGREPSAIRSMTSIGVAARK